MGCFGWVVLMGCVGGGVGGVCNGGKMFFIMTFDEKLIFLVL